MSLQPNIEKKLREYCKQRDYPEATFLSYREKILLWAGILENTVKAKRRKEQLKKAA